MVGIGNGFAWWKTVTAGNCLFHKVQKGAERCIYSNFKIEERLDVGLASEGMGRQTGVEFFEFWRGDCARWQTK